MILASTEKSNWALICGILSGAEILSPSIPGSAKAWDFSIQTWAFTVALF